MNSWKIVNAKYKKYTIIYFTAQAINVEPYLRTQKLEAFVSKAVIFLEPFDYTQHKKVTPVILSATVMDIMI